MNYELQNIGQNEFCIIFETNLQHYRNMSIQNAL